MFKSYHQEYINVKKFIYKYPFTDCTVYVKSILSKFKGQRSMWYFLNYGFKNPLKDESEPYSAY